MIELHKPNNVYLDESRQDRYGVPIYSVTGYVSTFEGFLNLEREWRAVLSHRKLATEFHATDFIARREEFDNAWTNAERDDFIDRLAYVASEHTTLGFGCSIREDTYTKAFGSVPQLLEEWKDPYGFCLWSCLTLLLTIENISRVTLEKPLHILFDNKPEFVPTASRIFSDLKSRNDPNGLLLGDFGFASSEATPALQAADLIAYESTRHFIESAHRGAAIEMHRVVKILNRKSNLVLPRVTDDQLSEFVDFLKNFVGPVSQSSRRRK